MLSPKSRRLLYGLAGTLVACLSAVAVFLGMERLEEARSTAALYQEQMRVLQRSLPDEAGLLSRREELEGRLESLQSRFYDEAEMSPYAFGALIKEELSALGMEIARYQVIELRGQSYLEFTAGGPTIAMIRFLGSAFASDKYRTMPGLTIKRRESGDMVDVVFQIGYEVRDGEDS